MSPSIWQLLLVVIVVFVIFGAGKLPKVMGDLGKGVRNLKDGLKGDDEETKELASEKIEEKKGEKK
ncbi:MAG: twin-arginine translocase TatA/TatE family subunit [Rickettsiales bacterium]|nr:twin-arginine translocase TatA/TatE family subunit [Pseudomonadota bacterium]MDA0967285.1 twin-arginine translocase TatA/TatE family subunit [Pseudomonadota bacterium]MDG4544054.1 twin-arginine translocase TatA/TatE family subunit [Rickettsiales bacterium]MDG4546252.1 twin-arginine translocase TatA/TatE family subunit [Rickettsiales bacterium]MDG4548378.1 twin-arginine translocase TatA/TatE family subunit [Rickettsiales bacterium]